MESKTIIHNNTEIYYRIAGSGKPVMLVHGFGEDGSIWQNQIEHLQKNYLLIVPDLPGSGHSELLSKNNVTMDDYVEVLKAILEQENIQTCTMLGHSMGGYITLAFVEKYPHSISKFGLIHSSAFADSQAKIEARKKGIEFIKTHGVNEFLKQTTPNLFYNKALFKKEIYTLLEKGSHFSDEALIQYYKAMMARPDRTEVLKTFDNPILLIIGQHDKAIPFTDSMQQTYLPSNAYVHILRNSAHMGMLEETNKVNLLISEFLQFSS